MRILSIDTSCDETAAAVTEGTKVLSNIIWSQASLHAKWGGVVPSIAKREHQERIDWVINRSLAVSRQSLEKDIDVIAVTVGPGLAIALEVGIEKAKELSQKFNKPFIPINHIEAHLISPLAQSKNSPTTDNQPASRKRPLRQVKDEASHRGEQLTTYLSFPLLGVVTSGGHTEIVWIKAIGEYEIIAQTSDDALGESLDKAARLLGFGYPGGEILEKVAKEGNPKIYKLPIPMLGREKELYFSYSGLKTAFVRLLKEIKENTKELTKKDISNLGAAYQQVAFTHFTRVLNYILKDNEYPTKNIFAGGGVMANVTLRKMLRTLCKKYDINVLFPYSKNLYTDNAAMVGIAAHFKFERKEFLSPNDLDQVDRVPRAKVDKPFPWE